MGLEGIEPGLLIAPEDLTRPTRRSPGVATKTLDVDLAEHRQVMVAGEHDGGQLAHAIDALVGARAVANDVAKAPQFVVAIALGFQYGLKGVQVAVHIGDNEGAHADSRIGDAVAASAATRLRAWNPTTSPTAS